MERALREGKTLEPEGDDSTYVLVLPEQWGGERASDLGVAQSQVWSRVVYDNIPACLHRVLREKVDDIGMLVCHIIQRGCGDLHLLAFHENDGHESGSQFACYEMGCLVKEVLAVLALVAEGAEAVYRIELPGAYLKLFCQIIRPRAE
jgi:hypothetical protein